MSNVPGNGLPVKDGDGATIRWLVSQRMSEAAPRMSVVQLWGVAGVVGLLVEAILRLWPKVLEPIRSGQLSDVELFMVAGSVIGLGYIEGFRGFHLSFSPRLAARALHLPGRGWLDKVLAPLFLMGLLGATKSRLLRAWLLVAGIVGLVAAVGRLGVAWRAIVDAGVIAGLSVGTASILVWWIRAFGGRPITVDPELSGAVPPPEEPPAAV